MQNDFDTVYKLATNLGEEEKAMMSNCLSIGLSARFARIALRAYDWIKKQDILDDFALERALSATPRLAKEALRLNNDFQDLEDNPEDVYMVGCHPTVDSITEEINALEECAEVSPIAVAICRDAAANAAEEKDGMPVCHMADFDGMLKARLEKLDGCDSLSFFRMLSDDKALDILSSKDPFGEIKKAISEDCRWIEWMAFVCR